MNSWLAWGGFVVAVVFLGWVAYHFSVRTLRYVTLALVAAGVVVVTGYGVTHQAPTARAAPLRPGGSTPIGLASIAENSGVAGSDLAGAIIRVVGLLWPRPRRYQVRVWVKPADPPAAGAGRRFGLG